VVVATVAKYHSEEVLPWLAALRVVQLLLRVALLTLAWVVPLQLAVVPLSWDHPALSPWLPKNHHRTLVPFLYLRATRHLALRGRSVCPSDLLLSRPDPWTFTLVQEVSLDL
jgi:hypothetical protein